MAAFRTNTPTLTVTPRAHGRHHQRRAIDIPMVFLLVACQPSADPSWVAMQTCISMPGLYMDGASQAIASKAIVQDELDVWHGDASYGSAGYGPVYAELELEGVGVIRGNSLCQVDAASDTEATVTRYEPDIEAMESWKIKTVWELERVPRTHTFKIEGTDEGYRARLGIKSKRSLGLSTEMLVAQGRYEEAIEEYRELHDEFPDPRILWRIRQISER